jgi:hypothetical protein
VARPKPRDLFIGGFLAIQVLLPLRYYLGGGGEDERFSWRMFSSQRLVQCELEVLADGEPVAVREVLGDNPYTHDHLPRAQPDVVEAFFDWYCGRTDTSAIELHSRCRATDGTALPERHASARCHPFAIDRGSLK